MTIATFVIVATCSIPGSYHVQLVICIIRFVIHVCSDYQPW